MARSARWSSRQVIVRSTDLLETILDEKEATGEKLISRAKGSVNPKAAQQCLTDPHKQLPGCLNPG
ncbi:hypothetical protein [Spirosoma jeollabukense]